MGLGFANTGLNVSGMANNEMKTLRFGIEIEVVGADRAQLAQAVATAVGGQIVAHWVVVDTQERRWNIVPDGSLSSERAGEVVSPILTWEDLELLQAVVRSLRAAGGRADASCGIHIHVDGATLDGKAVKNLMKMVAKQERYIEKALGIASHRLQRYCRPVSDALLTAFDGVGAGQRERLSLAWYRTFGGSAQRYDGSRYHGVNLNSLFYRGTVEFRWFAFATSKLHAGEVKAYVQFVLALVAAAKRKRTASRARREYTEASAKYDFRVFLLGLGMIGPEFATARQLLLKRLPGSAAWKHGRPAAPATPAPTAADSGDGEGSDDGGAPLPVAA